MPLIQWDQNLSVNIKEIDRQHKRLIELINLLHESMKAGKGKDVLGQVLGDLADYTVNHFGTEEGLFQKYGYPDYAKHKREHDHLSEQVLELKQKFESGAPVITIELMTFLKDWLNKHILYSDKKYTEFLNSKGVS